jgi:hypothetical protein
MMPMTATTVTSTRVKPPRYDARPMVTSFFVYVEIEEHTERKTSLRPRCNFQEKPMPGKNNLRYGYLPFSR